MRPPLSCNMKNLGYVVCFDTISYVIRKEIVWQSSVYFIRHCKIECLSVHLIYKIRYCIQWYYTLLCHMIYRSYDKMQYCNKIYTNWCCNILYDIVSKCYLIIWYNIESCYACVFDQITRYHNNVWYNMLSHNTAKFCNILYYIVWYSTISYYKLSYDFFVLYCIIYDI